MTTIFRALLVLIALASLTACGGGGAATNAPAAEVWAIPTGSPRVHASCETSFTNNSASTVQIPVRVSADRTLVAGADAGTLGALTYAAYSIDGAALIVGGGTVNHDGVIAGASAAWSDGSGFTVSLAPKSSITVSSVAAITGIPGSASSLKTANCTVTLG